MTKIHLSDEKIVQPTRIFIPANSEIEYIDFLNRLPVHSYGYIPDQSILVLDFDILRECMEDGEFKFDDIKIVYGTEEYDFEEFTKLFNDEKEFYVILH